MLVSSIDIVRKMIISASNQPVVRRDGGYVKGRRCFIETFTSRISEEILWFHAISFKKCEVDKGGLTVLMEAPTTAHQ